MKVYFQYKNATKIKHPALQKLMRKNTIRIELTKVKNVVLSKINIEELNIANHIHKIHYYSRLLGELINLQRVLLGSLILL